MAFSNINWGDVLARTAKTFVVAAPISNLAPEVLDKDWGHVTVTLLSAAIAAGTFLLNIVIQAVDNGKVNIAANDPDKLKGA